MNNLRELGVAMGANRPFIGLQTRGVLGHRMHDTIEDVAADHLVHMRQHQVRGPYLIAGYSGGSFAAFEIARQLRLAGEEVGFVGILDNAAPKFTFQKSGTMWDRLAYHGGLLRRHGPAPLLRNAKSWLGNKLQPDSVVRLGAALKPEDFRHVQLTRHWWAISERYDPAPYDGDVWLLLTESDLDGFTSLQLRKSDANYGWKTLVTGELRVDRHDSSHLTMLKGSAARDLADLIEAEIQRRGQSG
ncbi:MAG: hypothetical protein HC844_18100 [Tabrizicola sp.]|nr:hypothetical protein [Tabrizicola sp.]